MSSLWGAPRLTGICIQRVSWWAREQVRYAPIQSDSADVPSGKRVSRVVVLPGARL